MQLMVIEILADGASALAFTIKRAVRGGASAQLSLEIFNL